MKIEHVAYLVVASIIPIGAVSPKALVLMLGLAVVTFLSLNRDILVSTLRRGGLYFAYFLPLLLIGLASSLWSLELALSLSLALKLMSLVAIGCVATAAVSELPSRAVDSLKPAIHLGVVVAVALLLFEVATSGWLYRTVRGYAWEQVIFEPTGGINLDTPVNVDPEIVATISSSNPNVTAPPAPPSVKVRPDPAFRTLSLVKEPVEASTTYCAPGSPPPELDTTLSKKLPI